VFVPTAAGRRAAQSARSGAPRHVPGLGLPGRPRDAFVPSGRTVGCSRLARVIVVGILGAPGRDDLLALEVARRAAATGARVEMVGVTPTGAAGDRRLVELAQAGVGHATVTRTAAIGIDPADLELALRYLPEVRAIVLVKPETSLLAVATLAGTWAGAGLVIVGDQLSAAAGPVLGDAIVLDPPSGDPDGTFAGFVAALAVRLDAGEGPGAAWSSTVAALAVDPVR